MKNLTASLQVKALAERERRRRAEAAVIEHLPELEKCAANVDYFINNHIKIYEASKTEGGTGRWIPFTLWKEQIETLFIFKDNQLIIILKARQLGMTWLVLGYALWLMLFYPAATILLFSLRETEAVYLLDERLKGMFRQLPDWMLMRTIDEAKSEEAGRTVYKWIPRTASVSDKDSTKLWQLANGSSVRAFSTNSGDSYTATLAVVDEADLVPNLNALMRRVKPTIDGGGQMIMLSRADKSQPNSEFKRIYKAAKKKLTKWINVFLPWWVRPSRTKEWYEEQKTEIEQRTESLDDLWEQYPETDDEALAPRSLDKRIPPAHLKKVYQEEELLSEEILKMFRAPAINGLRVFRVPQRGRKYCIGVDPAEGNPTSDNSALSVADYETGEQVAKLSGKFQPNVIASHADKIGTWYNKADLMVERNNHGHAVLLWLNLYTKLKILLGPDQKQGWLDNARGKTLLYDACAELVMTEDCTIHDFTTWEQLSSIEGSSLRAPDDEPDDDADAFALSQVPRVKPKVKGKSSAVSKPRAALSKYASLSKLR